MRAPLDLRLCAASCRAFASLFSVPTESPRSYPVSVLEEEAAHLGYLCPGRSHSAAHVGHIQDISLVECLFLTS